MPRISLPFSVRDGITASAQPGSSTHGVLIRVDTAGVRRRRSAPIRLTSVKQWMALSLDGPYWMTPSFGHATLDMPKQTQFLLWERTDHRYGVLVPLVDGDLRATLLGTGDSLVLECDGAAPGAKPEPATLAYAATGTDPYELCRNAMSDISGHLRTFRLREDKPTAAFSNYLGWCTWDAFYHTVDARKLLWGLRTFDRGGVRPGFVMLDDGWEDRDGDFLNAFEPHRGKFPDGLATVISRARRDFGVRIFGIHHPFQGYWAGVNPKSALGKRYRMVVNRGCIRPWLGPKKDKLAFVHPFDAYRFYHDFYAYLHAQGVDMVKVDGQSALHLFTEGKLGRGSSMRAYQEAQQGAAAVSFAAQTIPCMSNGSDVLLNMNAANVWRNSTDYFPGRPAPVHQFHVFVNAMNNTWSSTVAQPDWDMFQSHQPEAEFHAAARAISGGPVYVCDKPGRQNFEILRKLCRGDGGLLRCTRPAQVCRDRLFVDTHRQAKLLKVHNETLTAGVLGVFHVCRDTGPIAETVRASDIPGLRASRWAVYSVSAGVVTVAHRTTALALELAPMGWEILAFAPVERGCAVLGLLDKYNGTAAIRSIEHVGSHTVRAVIAGGGRAGFWCERAPRRVTVNGRVVRWKNGPGGLVQLTLSGNRDCTVVVECQPELCMSFRREARK